MESSKKSNPGTLDAISRLDMASLLVDIGFEDVDPSSEQQLLFCVFHSNTATPSFSVNISKKVFHCFSAACGVKGNGVMLYALWKNISYEQAIQEIQYLPKRRDIESLQQILLRSKEQAMPVLERLQILTDFVGALPLITGTPYAAKLYARGLTKETLDRFGIRFYQEEYVKHLNAEKLFRAGISNVWRRPVFSAHPIIIPYYLGPSVAFIQGRQYDDDPLKSKYLGVRGNIPALWNHSALQVKPKQAFIAEGALDAMSLEQLGFSPALGIVGVDNFRADWAEDFKGVETVWVATDLDLAGEACFGKLYGLLGPAECQINRYYFPSEYLGHKIKDINDLLRLGWKPGA